MVYGSADTLLFIAWHFETASTPHKREKHFGTFYVHVCLMVLELYSFFEEEEKEQSRKKMTIFDFHFLGFDKAELKSEDI